MSLVWSGAEAFLAAAVSTAAAAQPALKLEVPNAPSEGWTIRGDGFVPASWIWIDVDDASDGSVPVHGPDAFQAAWDGTFLRTGASTLACGHAFQAVAFVDNGVAAVSPFVTPSCAPPSADPAASAAARVALDALRSAPGRAAGRLVVGQALRSFDFDRPVDEPVTSLTNAGLPAPKLVEVDVTDFGVTAEHDQAIYGVLFDHVARGGLVGVSYHAPNPFTGGNVYDRGGVNIDELADPSNPQTPAAWRWRAELDHAADVLAPLQAAGAVVLFRPLHESNGEWFWWGQADPAAFRAAWKGMFDYLAGRGLHNLLWVYSANRDLGGALYDPTRLYPGADLVDVVGLDIYDDDLSDAAPGEPGYAAMVALGKPFAITEYGPANGHDGAVELANPEVIRRIREQYPDTVLASAWYSLNGDNWQISDKPDPGALVLDPWAVTR